MNSMSWFWPNPIPILRCECLNMQDPQFYALGFVMLDYRLCAVGHLEVKLLKLSNTRKYHLGTNDMEVLLDNPNFCRLRCLRLGEY